MELKKYQQDTLNDLADYMQQLKTDNDLQLAYKNFWLNKGIDIASIANKNVLHSYDNTIKGVPRVMFKVPTAGGKTFIAANSLKVIFDHIPADRPKVVAWFVPSDSILKQTYKNLSDPSHPYCQRIKSHFNNRVVVVDKEKALSGTGIQPSQINEQLTIFVLSIQSFAANNKDGRRVFRENSSLEAYHTVFGDSNKIDGADETSLIQAIAHLNPVVIIDESHNFEAKLRIELFEQINPAFILDLTATPRQKSNIISFVDAKKLKDANMVKLPVVLYNRNSTEDVLLSAITLRRNLEKRAKTLQQAGGRYIRPIVLLQAQPKHDNDSETFEKVKQKLVDAGINESHIKIKTADKDEIKGIDLMDEDCQVRYIITVNALKEGWDCPFAYILASLANKTSRIDVEQIVGRVLRLPYTTAHTDEFLNMSYVFTSSNNFRETVASVIKGLNNAGFSSKDTRVVVEDEVDTPETETPDTPDLFTNIDNTSKDDNTNEDNETTEDNTDDNETKENESENEETNNEVNTDNESDNTDSEEINSEELKKQLEEGEQQTEDTETDSILQEASEANKEYEEETQSDDTDVPSEIKNEIPMYEIKDDFKEIAGGIMLPYFVKKIETGNIFDPEGGFVKLTKAILTDGFKLENADKNINFSRTDKDVVKIDLEQRGKDEFVPKQYKMNETQIQIAREAFAVYGIESKRNQLVKKIASRLRFDEVNEPHISNYIADVLKSKSDEELIDLFNNDITTERAFKNKIDSLVAEYQQNNFFTLIEKGKIECNWTEEFVYKMPSSITITKKMNDIPLGLYLEEDGDINNFEHTVISEVAALDNVLFWHRNPERGKGGFCINGFINHYCDFIIQTKNGVTVLLETKGDDRDNKDSRQKIKLGNEWAKMAGSKYRYFMVFDKTECDGAKTKEKFLDIMRAL